MKNNWVLLDDELKINYSFGGVSLCDGKGWGKAFKAGLEPIARNTIKMVSESNGQRAKARLQVSEFFAVDLK